MKKRAIALFLFFLTGCFYPLGSFADSELQPAISGELYPDLADHDVLKKPSKSLQEDIFSVSTDEFDSSDSLNRVSGEIDRGFSSSDQSYKSKNHHAAGPMAREKAAMEY